MHYLLIFLIESFKNMEFDFDLCNLFGSCLKTGQPNIFVIVYLLLHIKYIFFDSVSKILFNFFRYKNRR